MDKKQRERALARMLGSLLVFFTVAFAVFARLFNGENEGLLLIGAILEILALITAVLFLFFLIRSRETGKEKWRVVLLLLGVVLGYGSILAFLTADNSPLPAAAELGILFGGMILGTVCSAKLYKTSQKE